MATDKKKAAKKAAPIKLLDSVLWVVSKRSKLFTWTPVQVFPSRDLADEYLDLYESLSPYGVKGYKLDRVDLINAPIEDFQLVNIP